MTNVLHAPNIPHLDRMFSVSDSGVRFAPNNTSTLRKMFVRFSEDKTIESKVGQARKARDKSLAQTPPDQEPNLKEYDTLKNQLGAMYPSVMLDGGSREEHIRAYSGLVCVDIDGKDNTKPLSEIADILESIPYTLAFCESVSGDGFMAFFGCPSSDKHEATLDAIKSDLHKAGVIVDPKCTPFVNRARFFSHSKTPWIRSVKDGEMVADYPLPEQPSQQQKQPPTPSQPLPRQPRSADRPAEPKERVLNSLRDIAIDITQNREDWVRIAYGLANEYGEEGREVFHELSSKYANYTHKETDNTYTNALKTNKGLVGIGSVFQIASSYGVRVLPEYSSPKQNARETSPARPSTIAQHTPNNAPEFNPQTELNKARFVFDPNYTPPPNLCTANGARFATLRNFTAITGVQKSGKSFVVSCLVASYITGRRYGGFESQPPQGREGCVWIDTEQGEEDLFYASKRIQSVCSESEFKNLTTYRLRPYSASQAFILSEEAIKRHASSVGLVVVDGITDLMSEGVNDPKESEALVRWCMAMTDTYGIHLSLVIHTNRGTDTRKTQTGDGMRGHIGANIGRKAETVITVTKEAETNRVQIAPGPSRGRRFEPYDLVIERPDHLPREEAISAIVAQDRANRALIISQLEPGAHHRLAQDAFKGRAQMRYAELKIAVQNTLEQESGKKVSRSMSEQTVDVWKKEGVIVFHGKPKSPTGYYTLHPDLHPDALPLHIREAVEQSATRPPSEELGFGGGVELVRLSPE